MVGEGVGAIIEGVWVGEGVGVEGGWEGGRERRASWALDTASSGGSTPCKVDRTYLLRSSFSCG